MSATSRRTRRRTAPFSGCLRAVGQPFLRVMVPGTTWRRTMILVDHQIRDAVRSNYLGIEDGIQPASYDLRIGAHLYSSTEREPDKPIDLGKNGGVYRIPPYGQVVL